MVTSGKDLRRIPAATLALVPLPAEADGAQGGEEMEAATDEASAAEAERLQKADRLLDLSTR